MYISWFSFSDLLHCRSHFWSYELSQSTGGKAAGAWSWPLTSIWCRD